MMARIDTTIRRRCEACQAFTRSRTDSWGDEVCAEHVERYEDDDDGDLL